MKKHIIVSISLLITSALSLNADYNGYREDTRLRPVRTVTEGTVGVAEGAVRGTGRVAEGAVDVTGDAVKGAASVPGRVLGGIFTGKSREERRAEREAADRQRAEANRQREMNRRNAYNRSGN